MYQLIQAILRDREDATRMALLFANKTPEDILLRAQLDDHAQADQERLSVWYTVDRIPVEEEEKAWPYSIGHVNAQMIAAHLPPPSPETLILLCGPPPLVHYACIPNLEKLGYAREMMFEF